MTSPSFELLRKDVEQRVLSDRIVSPLWVLLPLLSILAGIVLGIIDAVFFLRTTLTPRPFPPFAFFGAGLAGILLITFVVEILQLYFFYILIRRRNLHFSRQLQLVSDIIAVLKEIASKKSLNIDGMIASMENIRRTEQVEETDKSAILWVILLLIPFVNVIAWLYIFYFLNYDFYNHERREDFLLLDIERAFTSLGLQFSFRRSNAIQHKNYILYLILTVLTFGLFSIYWVYTFIIDPNNHFMNHASFEEKMLQLVASMQ